MGVGIREWGRDRDRDRDRESGIGSRRRAAGCHLVNFRENECIQKGL